MEEGKYSGALRQTGAHSKGTRVKGNQEHIIKYQDTKVKGNKSVLN